MGRHLEKIFTSEVLVELRYSRRDRLRIEVNLNAAGFDCGVERDGAALSGKFAVESRKAEMLKGERNVRVVGVDRVSLRRLHCCATNGENESEKGFHGFSDKRKGAHQAKRLLREGGSNDHQDESPLNFRPASNSLSVEYWLGDVSSDVVVR